MISGSDEVGDVVDAILVRHPNAILQGIVAPDFFAAEFRQIGADPADVGGRRRRVSVFFRQDRGEKILQNEKTGERVRRETQLPGMAFADGRTAGLRRKEMDGQTVTYNTGRAKTGKTDVPINNALNIIRS